MPRWPAPAPKGRFCIVNTNEGGRTDWLMAVLLTTVL